MRRPPLPSPPRKRHDDRNLPPDLCHNLPLIDVSVEDHSLLPSAAHHDNGSGENMVTPSALLPQIGLARPPILCQHGQPSGVQPSRAWEKLSIIHEELPESQQSQNPTTTSGVAEMQTEAQPTLSEEPVLPKRKKRSDNFNLRKSLAWNHAFLTDEGVLDVDELSLVNKTFRKPPGVPKPAICNNTSRIAVSASEMAEQHSSKDKARAHSSQAQSEGGRHFTQNIKPVDTMRLGSVSSKGALSHKVIDTGFEKESRIRVPSSLPGKRPAERIITELQRTAAKQKKEAVATVKSSPSSIVNFTKKVSSVSRKMKDKIGKVLPTHINKQKRIPATVHDDLYISASSLNLLDSNVEESAKLTRCYSYTPFERFGRPIADTVSEGTSEYFSSNSEPASVECQYDRGCYLEGAADRLTSLSLARDLSSPVCASADHKDKYCSLGQRVMDASHSTLNLGYQEMCKKDPAIQKNFPFKTGSGSAQEVGQSGSDSSYPAKPSGLRKPSPKLGFFDLPRARPGPRLPTLPEKSAGFIMDGKGGPTGKHTNLSKFSSYAVVANKASQESMRRKYQGLSSSQESTMSMGSVRERPSSSSIPCASHPCRPEEIVKSSMTSVSAPVLQFDLSSPKIISDKTWDFPRVSACEKRPYSLEVKTDQEGNFPIVPCAKRPFISNDIPSVKAGAESVFFDAGRVGQPSSTDSSYSCNTGHLQQNSEIPKIGDFTKFANHQSHCNKGIRGEGNASFTGVPESVFMNDSNSGESKDMMSEAKSGVVPTEHSIIVTSKISSKCAPARVADSSDHKMQPSNSHLDITSSVSSHSRENGSPLQISKSSQAFRTGNLSILDTLGGARESLDYATERADGQTYKAVPSVSQSRSFSPADFRNGSSTEVSKSADAIFNVASQESSTRNPLGSSAVNVRERQVIVQRKNEKTTVFALAKKAVSRRFASSPSKRHPDQENAGTEGQVSGFGCHKLSRSKSARAQQSGIQDDLATFLNASPFSEERICAIEAAGEEMLQKQTGPVKHSPPDKTSPEPGPWSPVRKSGQPLGPFDCTKCVNTGITR